MKLPRVYEIYNSVRYSSLSKKRLLEVLNMCRTEFYTREAISALANLPNYPEAICELDKITLNIVKDGISIVATEESTGKLIGCQLNKLYVKQNNLNTLYEETKYKHPSAKAYIKLNCYIDESFNVFDFFKTNCYCETVITTVLKEFQNRSVARKLVELSVEVAQRLRNEENVKVSIDSNKLLPLYPIPTVVIGLPSSPSIIRIGQNIGFKQAAEINLDNYFRENPLDAALVTKRIYPVPVMYKIIEKQ